MYSSLENYVNQSWEEKDLLKEKKFQTAILETIELLDKGKIRVAQPSKEGEWQVYEWVKKAILLYFLIRKMETIEIGPLEFHDKIPLKKKYAEQNVRIVPHAIARYGAFLSKNVIMMPSYVNIGAYIGESTMIDTWATIGSCAQIGKEVHISGGVGIGGVLEPPQAEPVIIEDGVFLGSRSIVVEGARISKRAVLGANTVITKNSKIIDVRGKEEKIYRGFVPQNAVVIPGTHTKKFPAGNYQIAAALIIGERNANTDLKTSLNEVLRENDLVV